MWDGMFAPNTHKHRLYTGDIKNHIRVSQPFFNEEEGVVSVVVEFVRSPGERYNFEFVENWFPTKENGDLIINPETVGHAIERLWEENGGNLGAPVAPHNPVFWNV